MTADATDAASAPLCGGRRAAALRRALDWHPVFVHLEVPDCAGQVSVHRALSLGSIETGAGSPNRDQTARTSWGSGRLGSVGGMPVRGPLGSSTASLRRTREVRRDLRHCGAFGHGVRGDSGAGYGAGARKHAATPCIASARACLACRIAYSLQVRVPAAQGVSTALVRVRSLLDVARYDAALAELDRLDADLSDAAEALCLRAQALLGMGRAV